MQSTLERMSSTKHKEAKYDFVVQMGGEMIERNQKMERIITLNNCTSPTMVTAQTEPSNFEQVDGSKIGSHIAVSNPSSNENQQSATKLLEPNPSDSHWIRKEDHTELQGSMSNELIIPDDPSALKYITTKDQNLSTFSLKSPRQERPEGAMSGVPFISPPLLR